MNRAISFLPEFGVRMTLGADAVRNRLLAPQVVETSRISDAVEYLSNVESLKSELVDTETKPVFILSAGWGSGSTLVQRLIISSGEYLVWGEPLDQAAPIQRLAETICAIREGFPPDAHFAEDHRSEVLSRAWIANLIPQLPSFRAAHRLFLSTWLDHSSYDRNYTCWGVKEVRLTIDHARYLKWLYPNARFVFVYRDLYNCYLSCRNKPWISIWPSYRATPILSFSHHWNTLLSGFIDGYESVDGLLVKYEDLVSGKFPVSALKDYLELESIDENLLEKNVGGRAANRHPLILPEKIIMNGIAGDLRKQLGYHA